MMKYFGEIWMALKPEITDRFRTELHGVLGKPVKKAITARAIGEKGAKFFIAEFTALLDIYARKGSVSYGLLPADDWAVHNQSLYQVLANAAIHLCESTRRDIEEATGRMADDIIDEIRRDIAANQRAGKALGKYVDSVAKQFNQQVRWKARRIARTENVRAYNYGHMLGLESNSRVEGFEWLLSGHACDRCREVGMVDGRPRRLRKGVPFAHEPTAPSVYQSIMAPPLHPNCMCSIVPVLTIEDVKEWDSTFGDIKATI